MLPAPLSKIDVEGDTVAAVTDTARSVNKFSYATFNFDASDDDIRLVENSGHWKYCNVSFRFFLWEIHESGLRAKMRNECVASLLWSSCGESERVTVEKVGFAECKKPVIVTSVGKAYVYREARHYLTQRLSAEFLSVGIVSFSP